MILGEANEEIDVALE
jgi:hypothetical protein